MLDQMKVLWSRYRVTATHRALLGIISLVLLHRQIRQPNHLADGQKLSQHTRVVALIHYIYVTTMMQSQQKRVV